MKPQDRKQLRALVEGGDSLFKYMEDETLRLPKDNPFTKKLDAQEMALSETDLAGHRHYIEAADAAVTALKDVLHAGSGSHFSDPEERAIEAISRRIRALAVPVGLIKELPKKPLKKPPKASE